MKRIKTPLIKEAIEKLRVGDEVLLSGRVYTARDQAHKRLIELLKKKKRLPINLRSATIYYCGPTRTMPGKVIGSCGPTTSERMDAFALRLLTSGLKATIGKGGRSKEVIKSIKKHKAVYFIAIGGAGAYLSKRIKKARVIAFRDLGPEAIYELEVKDFPAIVGIDARGRSIFGL